jgi:invasion protein IalB
MEAVECAVALLSTPQVASVPEAQRAGTLRATPVAWTWTCRADASFVVHIVVANIKRASRRVAHKIRLVQFRGRGVTRLRPTCS